MLCSISSRGGLDKLFFLHIACIKEEGSRFIGWLVGGREGANIRRRCGWLFGCNLPVRPFFHCFSSRRRRSTAAAARAMATGSWLSIPLLSGLTPHSSSHPILHFLRANFGGLRGLLHASFILRVCCCSVFFFFFVVLANFLRFPAVAAAANSLSSAPYYVFHNFQFPLHF